MSNFIVFNFLILIFRLYCMIIGNIELYVGGELGF